MNKNITERTFHFRMARHGKRVGGKRSLHFGIIEMDHFSIIFYHIHLHK